MTTTEIPDTYPCDPSLLTVPTCDLADVIRYAERALRDHAVEPRLGERQAIVDLAAAVDAAQHNFAATTVMHGSGTTRPTTDQPPTT
jgi:hypothetical protein